MLAHPAVWRGRLRTTSRRLITLFVLVVWVLVGPIAMAYAGCAGMGAMCTGPCALQSCVLTTLPGLLALQSISSVAMQREDPPPLTILKTPAPPPRSLPIAA